MSEELKPQAQAAAVTTAENAYLEEIKKIWHWCAHIGNSKLRNHGIIFKFHHGMNNALSMYQHLDLIGRNAEQVACLDNLQAFIH